MAFQTVFTMAASNWKTGTSTPLMKLTMAVQIGWMIDVHANWIAVWIAVQTAITMVFSTVK